jgi:adenylate cyclase
VTEPADQLQEKPEAESGALTLVRVAELAEVSPGTVRRWVQMGLVPGYTGTWTPSSVAYVRMIARLRARGHSLERIRQATESGQLVTGSIEHLLAPPAGEFTLEDAIGATGLSEPLIEQIYGALGLGPLDLDAITGEDIQVLSYAAAVLRAGLPLDAFLQVLRVYGQVLAQIADAEVRLIHLYVHEPMVRAGVPTVDIAEEMESLTREILPLASPFMTYLHGRLLAHFVEQDMIGHVEADLGLDEFEEDGRLPVAIVFADLAGYARLTVEHGDAAAVNTVKRFIDAVASTLPLDARVIKTLGDEVMVVGSDAAALTRWAVDLQSSRDGDGPTPRIGIHYGSALYRDGDYFGREVNQAARVVARAAGGEVLVTRAVVDVAGALEGVRFERIGEVRLKGFSDLTELFVAAAV